MEKEANNYRDIGRDATNLISTAAAIGTLMAGSGEPPEQAKAINDDSKPVTSHTAKIAQNVSASLIGGGLAIAALARLRKREENQRNKPASQDRTV